MNSLARVLFAVLFCISGALAQGFGVKFLGDSHLGSDALIQAFRDEFFGGSDDSVGFIAPLMPKFHASEAVRFKNEGFEIISSRRDTDPDFPLCGVIARARNGAGLQIELKKLSGEFEVEVLHRVGGNGEIFEIIDASGRKFRINHLLRNSWEYTRFTLAFPVQIRSLREGAELGGYKIYRKNGSFADSCASNGAYSSVYQKWGKDAFIRDLARLNYELFIIAYGTNDALDSNFDEAKFYASLRGLVRLLRKGSRRAKILLIAPPRSPKVPNAARVAAVIRHLASDMGLMFYDFDMAMSEDGGWEGWRKMGLIRPDEIHLEAGGYERLGRNLARLLKRRLIEC